MLVKLVSLGLNPAIWKNVFHHLRNSLPDHPFAAGIFSSPGELAYLTREFYPHQWRREGIDFVLCEPASGADWSRRLAFLKKLDGESQPPSTLVMTLSALEGGIKQLLQASPPVELHLDNRARFTLSDPALVIRDFPKDFPRVRVNPHLTALRLKRADPPGRDVTPSAVAPGTVLSLGEIEAVVQGGSNLPPEEWLKAVLKVEKVQLPRGGAPGLLREAKGLYLCPGLPAARVNGITVGGVTFPMLLDLGQLSDDSPHFRTLRDALRKAGNAAKRRWRQSRQRLHDAESKADLPVVCGGGLPLLREALAERLRARGFARCSTLGTPAEGTFREPALLLQVGPWERAANPAQLEEPHIVPMEQELAALVQPLEGLLDWKALEWRPVPGGGPRLNAAALHSQAEELALRGRKALDGAAIADNRLQMLEQELAVLSAAQERLSELLEAREALQVWTGSLPRTVKQVLVFSHDPEEAGAVLQALAGIARKRWFDLSPFSDADALRTLDLAPVQHYLDGGMMVITAASREKLRRLQEDIVAQSAEATRALADAQAQLTRYGDEGDRTGTAKEALARAWLRDALDEWLDAHLGAVMERLDVLRRRHERRWFSRALVNRVAIIASQADNRPALLGACKELFPGFNAEHSRAVRYDYAPLDELPHGERQAVREEAGPAPLPAAALAQREAEALAERNRALFQDYLALLEQELEPLRADLLIIEQRADVAFPVLEHLRRALPSLAETPAIVVLPEAWSPPADAPLPWPRTRVVCLRRLGALTEEECAVGLRELYSA